MKKIIVAGALMLILLFLMWLGFSRNKKSATVPLPAVSQNSQADQGKSSSVPTAPDAPATPEPTNTSSGFVPPLARAADRITKKKFGMYITPQNSPVQPEKFKGYHVGTDFEIFPDELTAEVPVKAVCTGKIALKKYASGYGGVAVQSCELDGGPITAIYGHLNLSSIAASVGEGINAGDTLGILGKGYSAETNGERKHLHLGFHKGSGIDIRGYVQKQSELSNWMDPCLYVCNN